MESLQSKFPLFSLSPTLSQVSSVCILSYPIVCVLVCAFPSVYRFKLSIDDVGRMKRPNQAKRSKDERWSKDDREGFSCAATVLLTQTAHCVSTTEKEKENKKQRGD